MIEGERNGNKDNSQSLLINSSCQQFHAFIYPVRYRITVLQANKAFALLIYLYKANKNRCFTFMA